MNKRFIFAGLTSPIVILLVLLIVFFHIFSPHFLSLTNFQNILVYASIIGLLALGIGFVMLNGNIDLSVGSLLGLLTAIFVKTYNASALLPAIIITFAVALLVGLLHGLIVCRLKINSFIATLSSMIGLKGILFALTKEDSITLNNLAFTDLTAVVWLGVPLVGWLYLAVALLLYTVQQKTVHGRNIFYVGGNKTAACDAGIAVGLHQTINFVICSTIVALAAIILCAILGAATPNTGLGYELWAVTAAALGGIRLAGGVGSIIMVLLGGIVIGVLRNGMSLLRVSPAYIYIVIGMVLLNVVFIDKYLKSVVTLRQVIGKLLNPVGKGKD